MASTDLDVNAVPARNPQVVNRTVGDGEVLLHLETGAYHGLSATGALVWELVDGTRTVGAIVDEVRARYDGAPPEVDADVHSFLDDLRDRDLVTL